MSKRNLIFPQEIYSSYLTTINGIKVSKREVDIIACILNGRTAKGIASVCSIAPKTAETHIYNLMKKLGCPSRENLISLMESSEKILILKKYYFAFLTSLSFEQTLKEIAKLNTNEKIRCLIVHWEKAEKNTTLLTYLKSHLELIGIDTYIEKRENWISLKNLVFEPTSEDWNLYVIPKSVKLTNPFSIRVNKPFIINKVLFLSVDEEESTSLPLTGIKVLRLSQASNYYFFVFEILAQIFSENDVNSLIREFRKKHGLINWSFEFDNISIKRPQKKFNLFPLKKNLLKQRKSQILGLIFVCLLILVFGVLKFYLNVNNSASSQKLYAEKSLKAIARSDLNFPKENIFLKRSHLVKLIEDKLKTQTGIQTVALIGMGGVGKTTLARQYANQQSASIIWEINSDTFESLQQSFDQLAQALAKTEDEQKLLNEIQEIKNYTKRNNRILEFVKEHLKANPHWILLFDNVKKITDIQKYFPQDSATWGKGKVILTSNNSNIQNNEYVNFTLSVGELLPEQKVTLFIQIMTKNTLPFTPKQIEEAKSFLENIPSFPLDVTIAAYYIKSSNVTYEQYLEILKRYSPEIDNLQKNILQDTSFYTRTRYGIITASIQQMINTDKDFKDLFLFICLLDSQNIPRDLLNQYKNQTVVDNFIYNLKKYSLIVNESNNFSLSTFSIHRSTQAIILDYFKEKLYNEKDNKLIKTISMLLENFTNQLIGTEDVKRGKLLAIHLSMFIEHQNIFNEKSLDSLYAELGCLYLYLGNYTQAKEILEKYLRLLQSQHSKDYYKTAKILEHLGSIYRELGYYKKAKFYLEESLFIFKTRIPNNYLETARTSAYLGNVFRNLGDLHKARDFLQESLILYKKYAPNNYAGIARSLNYLGNIHKCLGDFEKGKELIEESLQLYKKYSLGNHIVLGRSLVLLGSIYGSLGYNEKSVTLIKQGFEILNRNCSNTHPDVLYSAVYLGNAYRKVGNLEKSRSLLEFCLINYQKNYEKDHIDIAWVSTYLAKLYRNMRIYDKSQRLLEKSLTIYTNTYGKDHIDTAWILRNLGKTYVQEHQYQIAQDLFEQSLSILKKIEHPEQFMCLECLADLYIKQIVGVEEVATINDLKQKAIEYLKRAQKIVIIHFPADSAHLIRINAKLKELKSR